MFTVLFEVLLIQVPEEIHRFASWEGFKGHQNSEQSILRIIDDSFGLSWVDTKGVMLFKRSVFRRVLRRCLFRLSPGTRVLEGFLEGKFSKKALSREHGLSQRPFAEFRFQVEFLKKSSDSPRHPSPQKSTH